MTNEVRFELVTNMLSSSLLAYIAVKRMPDRLKLCKFKRESFYLFYLDRSDTQVRWFFESLTSHAYSLLQPSRGQCPGRSNRRTILSPQTHPGSKVVLFCPLAGGTEGLQGRQQSLWLIYKSFSSFLCPYTPFSLLLLLYRLGSCHRKLSSTRSLQSRHISSNSVMSSRVSPSRLAKVELLEPVSMALSSDV